MNLRLLKIKSLHAKLKVSHDMAVLSWLILMCLMLLWMEWNRTNESKLVTAEREFCHARILYAQSREDTLKQENRELRSKIDNFNNDLQNKIKQLNDQWMAYLKNRDKVMRDRF